MCVTCVRSGAKGGRFLKTEYISQFESREDLIDALCASSHLPWYSAASFSCAFRGKRYVDGGMTRLVPEPPRPPAVRGSTVGTVGGTAVGAGSTAGKGSATGGGAGREAQGPVPLGVKISCMPEAYLRRMMLFNKKQVGGALMWMLGVAWAHNHTKLYKQHLAQSLVLQCWHFVHSCLAYRHVA